MKTEFNDWMAIPRAQRKRIREHLNGDIDKQSLFDNGCIVIFEKGSLEVVQRDFYSDDELLELSYKRKIRVFIVHGRANNSPHKNGVKGTYDDVTIEEASPRGFARKRGKGYRGNHRSTASGRQLLKKVKDPYEMPPAFHAKSKKNSI